MISHRTATHIASDDSQFERFDHLAWLAGDGFLNSATSSRAIVLLTDGEDMESNPVQAAKTAKDEAGITVFTIGLGDMTKGARIPTQRDRYIEYQGEQVWSKLDGKVLEQMAEASGGAYIPAGTKQVNMADFYSLYLSSLEQDVLETRTVDNYEARFQWFVAPAIALLAISLWPRRSRQRQSH
ncbi:VWA domain-containing protein [Rubripirellula amarantea]|nr:VWA domain-containing protein [Rubripirellula amarantea]